MRNNWVLLLAACAYAAPSVPVASAGRPRAAIILGDNAGESVRFAASELKRYFRALSGADVEILGAALSKSRPPQESWILIGGPAQNRLVTAADFTGVSGDAFVLKTSTVGKRPVVVAGGTTDAATMYAVFELASRMGVTFRLTGDILPERRQSLSIPALDVGEKPAIARRGFLLEASHHPSITMLSFEDYRRLLDQMAKMKYNYLQFWWFAYQPWLKYSYRGEAKMIGDVSNKDSGYMNSIYEGFGSRTTDDVVIGKEKFPRRRITAPELANVETPDQAFTAARDLLRRVIRYAQSRQIKMWLVDEMAALPPNLARYTERIGEVPFSGVFGTLAHPLDPVNREIQINRLKALVETYPEAEGYWLNFSEVYYPLNFGKHKEFFSQQAPAFKELYELKRPWIDWQHVGADVMVESNIGYFDLLKYLLSKRNEVAPQARLGLMTVGRGYVIPLFDKMLPKNIPFTTFDSGARAGWTPDGMPMSYFGGMGERERLLTPYVDDDGEMLGLQFNLGVYTRKDRIFSDGPKNGLSGVAGWMSRIRGSEPNSGFLAEAAWHPQLTPEQFYRDYSERIFGGDAADDMDQAFTTLEENQEYLGRDMRPPGGILGCCGPAREASMARRYSIQDNPFDGPTGSDWRSYVTRSPAYITYLEGSIPLLEKALVSLRGAQPKVAQRGKFELAYLINRTEVFRDAMRAYITMHQGIVAFDRAFQERKHVSHANFVEALDASLKQCDDACKQVEAVSRKFAQIVDDPADLEILYHLNVRSVLSFDVARRWLRRIVNFHEGNPYTEHVPFERIFPLDLRIGRSLQEQM